MSTIPTQTLDNHIYKALYRVDLHTEFYSSIQANQPAEMEGLRGLFGDARKHILDRYRGWWSYKTLQVSQDPSIPNGWIHPPHDLISWYSPLPEEVSMSPDGKPIFKVGNHITYVADKEDMSTLPPAIYETVELYFLEKLAAKTIMSNDKANIVKILFTDRERELSIMVHASTNTRNKQGRQSHLMRQFIPYPVVK